MDIQTPVMNGLEACLHMRKSAETKNISIIALTALAIKKEQDQILRAAFNDYPQKAIDNKLFMRTIRPYLTKQS